MRVVRNVAEALRVVCERAPLNLAVIDFDDGCHGMTLLSALNVCQPALPVIAVTSRRCVSRGHSGVCE